MALPGSGGGPDKSEQRTSLTAELAHMNFLVCANGYDVLPRVAHLLKGSNCVQTRKDRRTGPGGSGSRGSA